MGNHTQNDELNNELNIVYRYLVKKGVPHKDAEDAVQETAYKYLRYSDSIRSSKVRSWLIRVALNFYYDQRRKDKKYIFNLKENIRESESDEMPEAVILENERKEELHLLLNKLKPRFRELLLLKYESELSYDEISKLLGMSISSIKTNLFRARKKLVKLYEEANDGR
ncbi:RNA polymerase sigma factor [Virgibacillus doumboii]|uniref:RNA polymerase sigma factor n=1 Tax=Virgibacillus doumboii TaxID=2697503 RepID=UPI0013E07EC5|nr:sigma-70 family RNA polymerase sigma factor [Virgibacillus doumboii]